MYGTYDILQDNTENWTDNEIPCHIFGTYVVIYKTTVETEKIVFNFIRI
jgi:hypothetical protein